MKRMIIFAWAAALSLFAFSACVDDRPEGGAAVASQTAEPVATPAPTPAVPTPTPEPAAAGKIKTGLGIATVAGDSRAPRGERDGVATVESTAVAVTLDENNVITKISLDTVQSQVSFSPAGKITADLAAEVPTKMELRDGYAMRDYSDIGREWYEQAAAFEAWCLGKTPEQVLGMSASDEGRTEEADLTASVTISVSEFLEALHKAVENANEAEADAGYQTGLGIVADIASSRDAGDSDGQAQTNSSIAAITIDAAGTIVALTIDNAQTTIRFDSAGAFTTDINAPIGSKLEILDAYNMRGASAIGKEWFEQATAFSEWAVGKTVAEVTGMKTKALNDAHPSVPDEADLAASVTIDVGGFIDCVAKAAENAR